MSHAQHTCETRYVRVVSSRGLILPIIDFDKLSQFSLRAWVRRQEREFILTAWSQRALCGRGAGLMQRHGHVMVEADRGTE
jgi:hypothetical protein